MTRRHGVWRCICGCELYAKPIENSRKHHSKLQTYAPRDYVRKWEYERKNDIFLHRHKGKIGLLKADFIEDRGEEKTPSQGGGGGQRETSG